MKADEIRKLRLADPFKPFRLITADGRQLLVDKPYYLAIANDGLVLSVATEGEKFAILHPDDVKSVEMVDAA